MKFIFSIQAIKHVKKQVLFKIPFTKRKFTCTLIFFLLFSNGFCTLKVHLKEETNLTAKSCYIQLFPMYFVIYNVNHSFKNFVNLLYLGTYKSYLIL